MGTYNDRTLMRLSIFTTIFIIVLCVSTYAIPATGGTVPPSYAVEKNRLLVLGDSLTSGLYASAENATYARLVADSTNMQLARRHVSVLDLAISEWQNVKAWRPAIVVLEVGLNDVSRGLVSDSWRTRYHELVFDMRNNGAIVIVTTLFWAGIQPNHPNYAVYMAVNQVIRDAPGAVVADVWDATVNCEDCVSTISDDSYFAPHYHGDGFHPNDTGHRMIAETIIEALTMCVCDPNAPEPMRYPYYFPVMMG